MAKSQAATLAQIESSIKAVPKSKKDLCAIWPKAKPVVQFARSVLLLFAKPGSKTLQILDLLVLAIDAHCMELE